MKALKVIGGLVKGIVKGGVNPLPLSHSVQKIKEVKENPSAENIAKTALYFAVGLYLLYLLSKQVVSVEQVQDILETFSN